MQAIAARLNQAKYDAFRWRCELAIPKKLALAFGVAGLVGLCAQIRIPLPFTPVPITGQTFAVLLAAVLLGRRWGGISMAIYVGLGAAGVPWFSNWSGGVAPLAGPTGGYLLGFILASFFVGHFMDKYLRSRRFLSMLGLMMFANFVLIYGPGLLLLGMWMRAATGEAVPFSTLLTMGAIPFIAGDVAKVAMAAAIARGISPQQAYNDEVDKGKGAPGGISPS